jgi:D-alanyl-D-alanine carboxypeptidase
MQKKKRALSKKYIVVLMAIGLISVCAIGWGMTRGQTTQTMTQQPVGEETSSTQGEETPWNLRLINNDHLLPHDFTVETTSLGNGHAVDSRIYDALQQMLADAKKEGLSPVICSSYRDMATQERLYNQLVQEHLETGCSQELAEEYAAEWVAVPGSSEHQSGLAVDIVSPSYQILDRAQENTKEQKWLMAHCAEYGFILRYPDGKQQITGKEYEPWHYRYVGKEAAKEIMSRGICLEEYLGQ